MSKGIPNPLWLKEKNQKIFLKLCQAAAKPSVDWDKFRKLDKSNLFKEFDVFALSSKFRKFRLKEEGLCWQCGKNKPHPQDIGGLCQDCRNYFRYHNKERKKN